MLRRTASTPWPLIAAPLAILLVLLVAPLLLMVVFSVRPDGRAPFIAPFEPTLVHYADLFERGTYWGILGVSVGLAAIVALSAVLAAYPVAYFLRFHAGRRAFLFLLLLLIPFWTSYLLRVMAWKLMLGSSGLLNNMLLGAGLISEPIEALLYNRTAVAVTLVYVWIPFAALPILAALQRVEDAHLEAAADLGARPIVGLLRVTLPLSVPGVIGAFFLVFIPTIGEYVTPMLVGGSQGNLYGNVIQDFFTRSANWPLGSALSVIMMAITIALVVAALRAVDARRLASA
jgi:spermidine/putrescine transport system permease protein